MFNPIRQIVTPHIRRGFSAAVRHSRVSQQPIVIAMESQHLQTVLDSRCAAVCRAPDFEARMMKQMEDMKSTIIQEAKRTSENIEWKLNFLIGAGAVSVSLLAAVGGAVLSFPWYQESVKSKYADKK